MPACSVFGCSNNSGNHGNVGYYSFPNKKKQPDLHAKWITSTKRKNFVPTSNATICGKHFKDEDFNESDVMKMRLMKTEYFRHPRLKENTIPSEHLGISQEIKGSLAKRKSTFLNKKCVPKIFQNFEASDEEQVNKLNQVSKYSMTDLKVDVNVQCEIGCETYRNRSDNLDESFTSTEIIFEEESDYRFSNEEISDHGTGELPKHKNLELTLVIVYVNALMSLFKFCQQCSAPVCNTNTTTTGAFITVKTNCVNGHVSYWTSTGEKSHLEGNVYISSGIYLNGITFNLFETFTNTVQLLFLAESYFYRLVKEFLFPTVHRTWLREKETNYEVAQKDNGLSVAGDCQYDSHGFCAKYVTYSVMNTRTKKILDFIIYQRGMVKGDQEKAACSALLKVMAEKLPIKLFLSDRHTGVRSMMQTEFPHIHHEFDVWHLAKMLMKKINKNCSKSSLVYEWKQSIYNHMWWSSSTCENDSQLLKEKFTSVLKHICNVHEWDDGEKLKSCAHDKLSESQVKSIKWISPNSEDYARLKNIVMDKRFLEDISHINNFHHTGSLESYNNVRLKYVPKWVHFSFQEMYIRSIIAIFEHNCNQNRLVAGGCVEFSKSSGQWVYIKKYKKKSNHWRQKLLKQITEEIPKNKGVDCNFTCD